MDSIVAVFMSFLRAMSEIKIKLQLGASIYEK